MQSFTRSSISTSDVDIEELAYSSPEMKFVGLLDVSVRTLLRDYLCSYFAKVHATTRVPSVVCFIFSVIQCAQLLFAPLLVGVQDLWPEDSVITSIFSILGFFWQGLANDNSKVTMSFVLFILFILLMLYVIVRATLYSANGRVSYLLMGLELSLLEYVVPTFLPHLIVGAPDAWHQIASGNAPWNVWIVAVFCPVLWLMYLVTLGYLFAPRVMLEVSPFHTWMPNELALIEAGISLVCVFAVATKEVDGKARVTFPILNAVILALMGVLVFYLMCMMRRNATICVSAIALTGCVISIVQFVNLLVLKLKPEIVLCLIPPVFILLFLLLRWILDRKVIAILSFCDSCQEAGVNMNELTASYFKSKWDFIVKIRMLIEWWHPYMEMSRILDYGFDTWCDDVTVILLIGRIINFFPQRNSKMREIALRMAQCPVSFFSSLLQTAFLLQYRLIARTRVTIVTDSIRKQLADLQLKMDSLKTLMRRFWETVLQKSTVNFLDDANEIARYMTDLNEKMKQVTEDYPNNCEVLNAYWQFVLEMKRDYQAAKEMKSKIEIIEKFGQEDDPSMLLALRVFPNLKEVKSQEVVDTPESLQLERFKLNDTSKSSGTHGVESKGSDSDSQLDYVIQELTSHSKLGRVWIGVLVLVLATVITAIFYYIFVDQYLTGLISKKVDVLTFLSNLQMARSEICYLYLLSVTQALLASKSVVIDDALMDLVAPYLYTQAHEIQALSNDPDKVLAVIVSIKGMLTNTIQAFEHLDPSHAEVAEMNKLLYETVVYEDKNLYTALYQILIDATELLKITNLQAYVDSVEYKRMRDIITIANNYTNQLSVVCETYSIARDDVDYERLNGLLVLTMICNLLLVTLPFMLQLFLLYLQARALSESFSCFPNTEIRDIISRFGFEDSKYQDVNHVARLSHANEGESIEHLKLLLTFFTSFLPLLLCCLVTYYTSSTFMSKGIDLTATMGTLYNPFALMYMSFESLLSVFSMDVTGIQFASLGAREKFLTMSFDFLNNATEGVSVSLWSDIASVKYYFNEQPVLPLMNFGIESGTQPGSLFEILVSNDLPQALDLVISAGKTYITTHSTTQIEKNDPDFLSLWYWYANFSRTFRTLIFCDVVVRSTYDEIDTFRTNEIVVLVFGILWQCLACACAIVFLYWKHRDVHNALLFYHYVSPKVITQSSTVLHLIESGSINMESTHRSFANADAILSQTSHSVVITDRELAVIDYNEAFAKLTKQDNILGKSMIDILRRRNDDHSWPDMIQNISDCLAGRASPQFSMKVSADVINGGTVHLYCNVICMNATQVTLEGEHTLIEKVAIIFDDCTESVSRQEILDEEQRRINVMLLRVLPEKVLYRLEDGTREREEAIAFDSYTATIGQIRVATKKSWDFAATTPFDLFAKIFSEFDKIIEEYDMLDKVRTCFDVYTFSGGLLIPNSRPGNSTQDQHADQAVRFGLRLLSSVPEFSRMLDCEIELIIGIDIGGPVVAGVISAEHPSFQVIGPVVDKAFQMMATGVASHIQVTRDVYSIIITSGFKIRERGEVEIRGGKTEFTYFVDPT